MKSNKLYFATSFFSGLCIMGVEMSASRLLSPYFGSTNLIWSIIITIIMIGMGVGNYIGGVLADKHKKASQLYSIIFIAGLWIFAIPFAANTTISKLLSFSGHMFTSNAIAIAASLSSVIIFMPPLVALGIISPYLAKLTIEDLSTTGKKLGSIYVFNTIGSVIGSLLPSFFLIPLIGVKLSFFVFGLILMTVCTIYFLYNRAGALQAVLTLILAVVVIVNPMSIKKISSGSEVIYEDESEYNYLRVVDFDGVRGMSTSLFFGMQSLQFNRNDKLTDDYWDYAATIPKFLLKGADAPIHILTLGYGTGTFPTIINHYYSNIISEAVEIDEKVVDIASEFFDSDKNNTVIHVDDGRNFLNNSSDKYDIIFVDVYNDIALPVNYTTEEFFQLCSDRLTDDGIIMMNLALADNQNSKLSQSIITTLHAAKDYVYYLSIPNSSAALILATGEEIHFDDFENDVFQYDLLNDVYLFVKHNMQKVIDFDGTILTDDKNNIELIEQEMLTKQLNESIVMG